MRFHEMDSLTQNQMDFVPRERRNDIWHLIIAFITTMLVILISAFAPLFGHMNFYGPVLAVIAVAALCLYVIYRKQLSLDLVMSTEYQNLLFTQALSLGCSFCIIVRRDGTIVYASDGLANVFPRFDYAQSRALQGVFEQGIVRMIDRERIMAAIHSGTTERLIFPVFNHYNEKKDYIMTLEPLARPSGFAILRGREYLGQRSGAEMMPDILRSTSMDKLDRLLATTPTAHYTTDHYGKFEYVNPAFEHMLGYNAGEILESKLSLHHLVFSLGQTLVTEEYTLGDFSGEAVILHKTGNRLPCQLAQHTMRDTQGKLAGATGSILPAKTH